MADYNNHHHHNDRNKNALERFAASLASHQFVVLEGETDVARAVEMMQSKRGDTIIVTKDGRPAGIVTDSDILDKVVTTGSDSDTVLLRTIMTAPIITADAKATVREVLEIMRKYRIKHVPIIEGGRIIGMVTQRALADSIRTSVLERTFRKYRSAIRDQLKFLLGNMGLVVQFAGILLVFPALVGAATGETAAATGVFLAVAGLFATGFFLNTYGERGALSIKQASILVVSSFLLLGVFGSIPYIYVNPFGQDISAGALVVNSFFESISGFTTTGLSMVMLPEEMPDSLILYRSYTQWVGGLSFVYLVMTLFYPEQKLSAMRGFLSAGGTSLLNLRRLFVIISVVFAAYTAILVTILYLAGGTNVLYNLSAVFAAVTGGGFSPSSTFIAHDNVPRLVALGAGMVISALPFAFHYSIFAKQMRRKNLGIEILTFGALVTVSAVLFVALAGQDALTSAFHVVSASTNAGFQFINPIDLPPAAKALLMVAMMVGGTAFSPAGGIKVGRFLLIYQKLAGKKMSDTFATISTRSPDKLYYETLIVIGLFVATALATGAAVAALEQVAFEDALFEAISALTTTGLSTGIIAIDSDFASKLILAANMVAGKFEIIAILYIFVEWLRR